MVGIIQFHYSYTTRCHQRYTDTQVTVYNRLELILGRVFILGRPWEAS